MIKERAYAKINLGLDVVSKREDGYHELNMIMLPIDFYDVLCVELNDETLITSNVSYLPSNDKNTIFKAISIMKEEFNIKENFKVELIKNIPTQAGLAGGSADGAAMCRAIIRLLNLKIDNLKMIEVCNKIGSDVPFCYFNKPAVVKGAGEKLSFFEYDLDFYLLLVKPRKGVSTKLAFSNLDLNKCDHPNIDIIKDSLINKDYDKMISNLSNSLEQPAFDIVKDIKKIKKIMVKKGLDVSLMSGSGSTVFGITRNKEIVDELFEFFRKNKYFARKTIVKK